MGRGGKVGFKQGFRKKVRSKDKVSDDSDEDYVISDEEDEVSEDELEDYCSSVDGYPSDEGFDSFIEEEEETEEKVAVKKVVRSKTKKGNLGDGKNGVKIARKRKRVRYGDGKGEDEDYEEEEEDEDEEFAPDEDDCLDDDDDDEFSPDEDDCLDEEEELVVTKKMNTINNKRKKKSFVRKGTRKKGSVRSRKRRKSKVSKNHLGRKRRRRGLRKTERSNEDDDDFIDDEVVVKENNKLSAGRKRRRFVIPSDSDFVSSGSSDEEFTISEDEREQLREANQLCGSLKTSWRNSSSSKIIQADDNLCQPRKSLGRKGKEKIEEVKGEVAKQVCGICLSEEDKRRLRGTLNCCTHYFCFTCIMEWSKVESRCPVCKQRFKTITKPERSTAGVDLRSVVIQVPERDQVYQPSEEDLRSFLDPYENVICSECHQGGDDALMLLCDICDSSAHTYCVGLGCVVPEGNWYCDGCRPVALGPSSSQAQDSLPDQMPASTNLYSRPSPIVSFGEGFDCYPVPSPRVPLTSGSGNPSSSPRFNAGDVHGVSPGAGAGAPTLSGRRLIHRRIQSLLSMNRMNFVAGNTDGMPTANLNSEILNSQVDHGRETFVSPARAQETQSLHEAVFVDRLHDDPASLADAEDLFAPRLNHLRRRAVQDPTITALNGRVNLTLWPELAGINSLPSFEQLHQCSSLSNILSDGHVPSFTTKDGYDLYLAREQLQSIVRSHLNNLSRDIELDPNTFKDIAGGSTHTILAACGLDHSRNEVHSVPPPSICPHVERVSSGQTSLMKSHCPSCFDCFVKDVVKRIMDTMTADTRLPQWLSLGL